MIYVAELSEWFLVTPIKDNSFINTLGYSWIVMSTQLLQYLIISIPRCVEVVIEEKWGAIWLLHLIFWQFSLFFLILHQRNMQ